MKPFHQTEACRTRRHCAACLAEKWHKLDACPHGVTPEAAALDAAGLRESQREAALQAQARGEVYAPPGRCKGCGG